MKLKNAKLGDIVEAAAGLIIVAFACYSLFFEGRSLTETEIILLFAGLGAIGIDGNARDLIKGDGPRE